MEKCVRVLVNESGNIERAVQEISCNPITNTVYPNWFIVGAIILGLIVLWFTVLYPMWNIWASKLSGEASLQEAFRQQQIQIAEAKGRLEAAQINKEAALIEAEAVSKQINIIGEKLQNHDLYLKWQWIEMMNKKPDGSVIYVPTEAGLPILEAGKR